MRLPRSNCVQMASTGRAGTTVGKESIRFFERAATHIIDLLIAKTSTTELLNHRLDE